MTMALLSPEALAKYPRECGKYPPEQRQSAVMSALAIAQDEHGWLSTEVMDFVATRSACPRSWVYEVATFYNDVQPEALGKHKLVICTNLPCALSGAVHDAAEHLKRSSASAFNETTSDGRFTLKEGECLGACGDAPVLLVNNKRMCGFMTPEKLDRLSTRSSN
jgi:NADH-quinone oxidoreductase subunit E